MGIKKFFGYFKTNFGTNMTNMKKTQSFGDIKVSVDNLLIDLNGIFHPSAQKIYEYGNHKPLRRLLGRRPKRRVSGLTKQIRVFEDVCQEIESLVRIVQPNKRVVLCVDGPAPLAKQQQQRSRRFRSADEKSEQDFRNFDSNKLTPGTKFMDYLTKYIDWYIRKRLTESSVWKKLDIIFSNEKAPGEGEHLLFEFVRSYGDLDESYCIHGLDADLIMLALGSPARKFWILRDDMYDPKNDYFVINIESTRKQLAETMRWEEKEVKYYTSSGVEDFIFLCFMVGNDFLPHVPSLEIIEGGIDCMIDVYKNVGASYGHITSNIKGIVKFNKKALEIFLGTISQYEKGILQDKLAHKGKFFPDPTLENNAVYEDGKWTLDMEAYKKAYYELNFNEDFDIKKICHEYLEGLQWVISYYTKGVPHWKWCFKHHYAPFASDIALHIDDFKRPVYGESSPTTPFQQLLCVLPPRSHGLIPSPLNTLLTDKKSALKKFCPDKFKIDISGKRQEWEGITLLPMIDFETVEKEYSKEIKNVNPTELRRNRLGQSFVYFNDPNTAFEFKSFYGNIPGCKVKTEAIDLL